MVKGPYGLFVRWIHLDKEGLTGARVAVADHIVAVREHLERRDPRQADVGELTAAPQPSFSAWASSIIACR